MIGDDRVVEVVCKENAEINATAFMLNVSPDTSTERVVKIAKREAYLINFILICISGSKLIFSLVCLNQSEMYLSFVQTWLYLVLQYDLIYILHLILMNIALSQCSQDQLLNGIQQLGERSNSNVSSFFLQKFLKSRHRPINGLLFQENAEKLFWFTNKSGQLCRIIYLAIFFFGNVLFFVKGAITPQDDRSLCLLSLVFLIFGYIYFSIPILLCLFLPCILFYTCFIKSRRQHIFNLQIKPDNIKGLLILPFSNITSSDTEKDCAICFGTYLPQDQIVLLPCNQMHYFHEECIQYWIEMHGNCPLCRKNIDLTFQMQSNP